MHLYYVGGTALLFSLAVFYTLKFGTWRQDKWFCLFFGGLALWGWIIWFLGLLA